MRFFPVALVAVATTLPSFAARDLSAQSTKQLTAQDYARAEKFLGNNTVPLVTGLGFRPTWLEDGRFWYRATAANGSSFLIVDPVKKTRLPLFDQTRLAAALASATGGRVEANRLSSFGTTLDLAKDNRSITVGFQRGRWKCDLQTYICAAADSSGADSRAPANSSISPDGKLAAYIKDYNLWVRELSTGKESQLTTDGIKDYGYATDNAGWAHSDRPVLTWSPDSKQIATFQQDERGTREMYLVSTNVGAPKLEAWHYPYPGDSVIFRISRVIIHLLPNGGGHVLRLDMPPDAHRSTVSDHVNCGGEICDAQWYPDGSHLAFISSSRDHKTAWMRVADAKTGDVKTLIEEHSAT